jgi:hypothetical protein
MPAMTVNACEPEARPLFHQEGWLVFLSWLQ